mmetsp:Transcript_3488/g.12293  ORF Transcript_3488/g.12293 Transcript_3488/m.12293 type:complete len:574 (+) Transcript_3488:1326-3047(+)
MYRFDSRRRLGVCALHLLLAAHVDMLQQEARHLRHGLQIVGRLLVARQLRHAVVHHAALRKVRQVPHRGRHDRFHTRNLLQVVVENGNAGVLAGQACAVEVGLACDGLHGAEVALELAGHVVPGAVFARVDRGADCGDKGGEAVEVVQLQQLGRDANEALEDLGLLARHGGLLEEGGQPGGAHAGGEDEERLDVAAAARRPALLEDLARFNGGEEGELEDRQLARDLHVGDVPDAERVREDVLGHVRVGRRGVELVVAHRLWLALEGGPAAQLLGDQLADVLRHDGRQRGLVLRKVPEVLQHVAVEVLVVALDPDLDDVEDAQLDGRLHALAPLLCLALLHGGGGVRVVAAHEQLEQDLRLGEVDVRQHEGLHVLQVVRVGRSQLLDQLHQRGVLDLAALHLRLAAAARQLLEGLLPLPRPLQEAAAAARLQQAVRRRRLQADGKQVREVRQQRVLLQIDVLVRLLKERGGDPARAPVQPPPPLVGRPQQHGRPLAALGLARLHLLVLQQHRAEPLLAPPRLRSRHRRHRGAALLLLRPLFRSAVVEGGRAAVVLRLLVLERRLVLDAVVAVG